MTLHASDLAGNTSVTTFNYTLNGDTTPPVLTLGWPQDGMTLCGDTFTVDGWVDDPTAAITVTWVDAGGNTSSATGVVERDGRFWVEDLPLAAGTSVLTLTATDAWGNSATTTFSLTKSGLVLTLDTVDPSQLFQAAINLSGTVNFSCAISVNGVAASVPGDGTWHADNVPVNPGGTASFSVIASPPPPVSSVNLKASVDQPDRLYVVQDEQARTYTWHQRDDYYNVVATEVDWADTSSAEISGHDWADGQGGYGWYGINQHTSYGTPPPESANVCAATIFWPPASWPNVLPGSWSVICGPTPDSSTPTIGFEHCVVSDPLPNRAWSQAIAGEPRDPSAVLDVGSRQETYTRTAQTTMKLFAGGKAVPHRLNLFEISGAAWQITDKRATPPFNVSQYPQIAAPNIIITDFGPLGGPARRHHRKCHPSRARQGFLHVRRGGGQAPSIHHCKWSPASARSGYSSCSEFLDRPVD